MTKADSTVQLPEAKPEKAPPHPTENLTKKVTRQPLAPRKKAHSPTTKKLEPAKPSKLELQDSPEKSGPKETETQNNQHSSAKQPQSTVSGATEESIEYEKALIYLLSKSKRYPERARRRGTSGDGTIRLKLHRDGSISKLEIAKSTESDILDQELTNLVKRASPLPPVPDGGRTDFLIPVRFSLRD